MNINTLKRQHSLLVQYCPPDTIIDLEDACKRIRPQWCQQLAPVIVPRLVDGPAYRDVISRMHKELLGDSLLIEEVPDEAFFPVGASEVRFTVKELSWRSQWNFISAVKANGGNVTGMNLFTGLFYLLDLCVYHNNTFDAVAHPMWRNTVSNQAMTTWKKHTAFIRSESVVIGRRVECKRLIVSAQHCRESIAPFFLQDLSMPP